MQLENPQHTTEQAEARDREAFEWFLSDPRGMRIARQILRFAGVKETGALRGDEALVAAGKRSVGCYLDERMQLLAPEHWLRFETEHLQERHLLMQQAAAAEAKGKEEAPKDPTP